MDEGPTRAGRFAKKKLRKSFETLTQEYVFTPLGMTSGDKGQQMILDVLDRSTRSSDRCG